jgi:hypothetical protein
MEHENVQKITEYFCTNSKIIYQEKVPGPKRDSLKFRAEFEKASLAGYGAGVVRRYLGDINLKTLCHI